MRIEKPIRVSTTTLGQALLWRSLWLLPVLLVAYFTYLAAKLQLDDALIYLRYVRNFHEGLGLTYNPPELFNGLTSPLFTLVMVVAAYISSNLIAVMVVISGIFFLSAALLGGHLLASGRVESAITASVLAGVGYFYSTTGMETGLYLTLIAASFILYRNRSSWFVITLALLICTRSEGVFFAGVLGLDYLYQNRRLPDWRFLLASCIILSLPFAFNYFYYGALMPATGGAKIAQGRSGLWGEDWLFLHIQYFANAFFSGSKVAPSLLVVAALIGVFAEIEKRTTWLIVLSLGCLLAFYVGLNIPNYHWYYAPFFYFLFLFACRGVFWLSRIALARGLLAPRAGLVLIVLGGAGYVAQNVVSLEASQPNQSYIEISNWLKENTPETSSVAMVEIGTIGWHSEREIVDILGLVTPFNAEYIGDREFMRWLLHYQPDYIIRHDPIWPHEQSITPLEKNAIYTAVDTARIPGLVLLQRSPQHSKESVHQFVSFVLEKNEPFEKMLLSSSIGAPYVMMQGASLFAHAPMSLSLTLEEPIESIAVGFGVREAAQGLHHRVCFAIRRAIDNEALLDDCIDAGASVEEMHVERSIQRRLDAKERLLFDIRCEDSCNNAWSYWSEVVLEKAT